MRAIDWIWQSSPLPEGWSDPEGFEDSIVADGVRLRRAGFSSIGPTGVEVTGSAAEARSSPAMRASYELLERVGTLEAIAVQKRTYPMRSRDGGVVGERAGSLVFPSSTEDVRWRFARSNGIALHTDWESACDRAFWELCERDRVLRAWYGETVPRRVDSMIDSTALADTQSYAWEAYEFPEVEGSAWSHGVHVAGLFGFPVAPSAPLAFGYAAGPSPIAALAGASREATQMLAFLWGETIPGAEPEVGPTALHHLERALWPAQHRALRRWLAGDHWEHGRRRRSSASALLGFVDLTPTWMSGGLRVAKAVCEAAEPLTFGPSPFASHLPPALQIHPVC